MAWRVRAFLAWWDLLLNFWCFQGSYSVFPIQTLLCVVGTGLTAVYFVILINRTCFGKLDNERAYYDKVTGNERAPALVLAALVVVLGLQPNWLVHWSETTSRSLVAAVPMAQDVRIALQADLGRLD